MRTHDHGFEAGKGNKVSRKKNKNIKALRRHIDEMSDEHIARVMEESANHFSQPHIDVTGRAIFRSMQNQLAGSHFHIQAKLEISHPEDHSEKQADDLAQSVMHGSPEQSQDILSNPTSEVSRMSEGDEGGMQTSGEFDQQLQSTKGQGQKLDEGTKSELEEHTGNDLSGVNIHTGTKAHGMSESINAKAFTHGQDIYFKQGNYNPDSQEGKELLAHEVAHTVQQGGKSIYAKIQRQGNGNDELTVTDLGVTNPTNTGETRMHVFKVLYYKSYACREFDEAFFSAIYGVDEISGKKIVDYIEQDLSANGKKLDEYWTPHATNGYDLVYTNTNGAPQSIRASVSQSKFLEYKGILFGNNVSYENTEYSEGLQDILTDDLSGKGDDEQRRRKMLQDLIKQISPEEWASGDQEENGWPDDIMIKRLLEYLTYRNSLYGNLENAITEKDPKTCAILLNGATNQVMLGMSIDLRLKLIRFLAENEAEERESAILKLIQTVPSGQVKVLLAGLSANKSELIRLLQKVMTSKTGEYMETIRTLIFVSMTPEQVSDFIISSAASGVDGNKRLPWFFPKGIARPLDPILKYENLKLTDDGKVTGEYTRYNKQLGTAINGDLTVDLKEIDNSKPENHSTFSYDPFDIITLVIEYPESVLDKEAGQEVPIPAIMLLYIHDEAMTAFLKSMINVVVNIAFLAVGAGMLTAAKSAWMVIEGALAIITATIGVFRSVIEEMKGGKEFLKYYDIFVLFQGIYAGGRLLIELPQLAGGVVKMWNMFKLANKGDANLINLAEIGTNVESLDAQLQSYIQALDKSQQARVWAKIAAEQMRIEQAMLPSIGTVVENSGPAVSLARSLRDQIILGALNAKATILEIKTFIRQQAVYKELAALSDDVLIPLITKARNELDTLIFVAAGLEDRFYLIMNMLSEDEKVIFRGWIVVTKDDATAQELMIDYLIGDNRLNKGLFSKFGLDTNTGLRKKMFDYINLNNSNSFAIISSETMLYSATDVKGLENIVNGNTPLKYLFRGTSKDFGGGGNLLAETTSSSTDPAVATIFGLNSEYLSQGNGVLLVGELENFSQTKVSFPNVVAEAESEVAVAIKPSEFAKLPGLKQVSIKKARSVLNDMGFKLPSSNAVKTYEDVSRLISNTPKLTPDQILQFYSKVIN